MAIGISQPGNWPVSWTVTNRLQYNICISWAKFKNWVCWCSMIWAKRAKISISTRIPICWFIIVHLVNNVDLCAFMSTSRTDKNALTESQVDVLHLVGKEGASSNTDHFKKCNNHCKGLSHLEAKIEERKFCSMTKSAHVE